MSVMAISIGPKLFATYDHFLRRFNELNDKRENFSEKISSEEKTLSNEETLVKDTQLTRN